jgi:hypothetical protein
MLFGTFITNIFIMGSISMISHHIFKNLNIERQLFEKYSVNMMRSIICGAIAHEAYYNFHYIWEDKCLENVNVLTKFKNYHDMFLSYFIFDTTILWYQVYLKIEKSIRIDLLFHHLLAILALIIIEDKGMYSISLLIGLSEGMSLVTGPKLLSMYYGNKYITNLFIAYRLIYLVFVRMLFIWPTLIYFYNNVTNSCEKYKNDKNLFLVISLVLVIMHAEINWLHSGRKELARI